MGYFHGVEEVSIYDVSTKNHLGRDMKGHKVVNVKDPDNTDDKSSGATVNWINQHFVHKKVNDTQTPDSFSNVLEASLNMNGNRIFNTPVALVETDVVNLSYLRSHIYSSLSSSLLWELYTNNSNALYKFDRGISTELIMDSSTRKVSKLIDQTLFENHANQSTLANQPTLCSSANSINNRYYLNFSGSERMISDIDLNVANGSQDIVNIFIVYKLNSFNGSYWTRNGLFGHDDGLFDKFCSFGPSGDLVVSGTTNDHIVIGSNSVNGKSPIAPYLTKANAGDLNKWIYLSIHWNVPTGTNGSKVWCNGKKINRFYSKNVSRKCTNDPW